ncbi:MAG TPA: hypothetical protein VK745_22405, partial [Polyangiaceae bacterium]|nr:hypothetical protein [Polyangiaceae bacterium]
PLRAVVVTLTLLLGCEVARAEEATPFELDWRAPAGCPGPERLRAEITRLIGPNAHPEGTTHVSGEVSAQDNGTYLVQLELEQGGHPGERTLTGATCAEVSRAAALLIALAIAPDAAREEPEAPPPPPPPPPAPPRPPPPSRAPPPAASVAHERTVVIALGPAAEIGLLPTLSPGGEVSLGAALDRFSLEAYGSTYLNQAHEVDGGLGNVGSAAIGGHFSLRSFGARGCAVLAPGDLSFAACVGGSVNHLAAQGYGVTFPSNNETNVGAVSLAVRVELRFSAHTSLRLDAGPSYMLGQARFVLNTNPSADTTCTLGRECTPVYQITSFDAGGSLKLAWRF